jgi:hypothetical protein
MTEGCQWIGAEQKNPPFKMCGCTVFPGRSYCEDHVWQVYRKGTSQGNKRKIAAIERELAEVKHLESLELDD